VVTADERTLLNLGVSPAMLPGTLPINYYPFNPGLMDITGGVTATDASTAAADHPPVAKLAQIFNSSRPATPPPPPSSRRIFVI